MAACSDDEPAPTAIEVPEWAKVAPEQIAEAKKHGVPVAFENDLGMRFVLTPAGTFLMGSPEDEHGRAHGELQHRVTLSSTAYMQITEVTNDTYRRFRPRHSSGEDIYPGLDEDDHPVVRVSHEDAQAFATWLSEADKVRGYALPTEARWEQACRAGTTTDYWWTEAGLPSARCANTCEGLTPPESKGEAAGWPPDGHLGTAPVGSYRANPWGLYDMAGNVHEWCADWWVEFHDPQTVRDPVGPGSGEFRVMRGGAAAHVPATMRSAARWRERRDAREPWCGFRLVSPLPVR